jgi:ABC-2 type transport system permease protein
VAGVFVNSVFGLLRAYVLLALYAQRTVIGGYDAAAAVTYTWVTQAMVMTVFTWFWRELAFRVRTGDIATDLVRPVHPMRAALAFDLGRALYHALYRGVPPFVVGALLFQLTLPASPIVWVAFVLSVAVAVIVSFGFRWLYNTSSFWLLDDRGVAIISGMLMSLLSGFYIPVGFFPDWLAAIAHATPFPSMLQTPVDIFVGRIEGPGIVIALATQLAWAILMLAGARAVYALGVRRLVVQGG